MYYSTNLIEYYLSTSKALTIRMSFFIYIKTGLKVQMQINESFSACKKVFLNI